MKKIDEVLGGESLLEILSKTSSDFNYYDNYFYFDGYGFLRSTSNPTGYFMNATDFYSCNIDDNFNNVTELIEYLQKRSKR